jgi:hypothetical protein
MWADDQNEMMISTFNCKNLYLIMLIVCRKNLCQSDRMDCKIMTIEVEEKVFLMESPDRCECIEIQ